MTLRSLEGHNKTARGKALVSILLALLLLRTAVPALANGNEAARVANCSTAGGGLTQKCAAELNQLRIAVVKSTFTDSPYSYYPSSSFYAFYHAADAQNVVNCTDENVQWLSSRVVDEWGKYGQSLNAFVQSSIRDGDFNASLTRVVTDIQVGNGSLFASSGQRRFDVAIVGFSEYVTATEYQYLKRFVSTGGLLVVLSPAFFRAEVVYDPNTNTERLVSGHGWSFDGTKACRGLDSRWHDDNINWIGGDYCCFYTSGYAVNGAILNQANPIAQMLQEAFGSAVILREYHAHESTALLNLTNTDIVARWNMTNMPRPFNASIYSHRYGAGEVFVTGVFGSDIIASSEALRLAVYGSMLEFRAISSSLLENSASPSISATGSPQLNGPPAVLIGAAALGTIATLVVLRLIFRRGT